MTIDFTLLNPGFAKVAENLLDILQEEGYVFEPVAGFRSMQEQAKLWRQSRTKAVINEQITSLEAQGCEYLANVLRSVGPQYGLHVTNALPGMSEHEWGEAMDVRFVMMSRGAQSYEEIDNPPNWAAGPDFYKLYADKAVSLGLTAGYYFHSFQDKGHVQFNKIEIPQRYTLKEINDHFASLA